MDRAHSDVPPHTHRWANLLPLVITAAFPHRTRKLTAALISPGARWPCCVIMDGGGGGPGGKGTDLERALGPWGSPTCPLPPRRSSSSLWERPPRSCQPTAHLWRKERQDSTLKCLQCSVDALRKVLKSE
jgi:hypothetical protein